MMSLDMLRELAAMAVSGGKPASQAGSDNDAFRDRWLAKTLAEIPAETRLLDAGAGEQRFRKYCTHLRYVSQDVAQYDGAGDAKGLQTGEWKFGDLDLVCDIAAIPEPDGSFGAILCTEVLEHIADPLRALDEFARLIEPGGQLIVTAPFCSLTHFAPYHFSTGLSRYYYEQHLPARGFEIVEMTPNGNYFEFLAQELQRLPSIAERYAAGGLTNGERLVLNHLLGLLGRCSAEDRGSSELLCFGWCVRAKKRLPEPG